VLAGYGIAIPVGPIAILIIELGIGRGFGVAVCAGAGAASADLIYATVAVVAGAFIIPLLAPYSSILHLASACVLIMIGVVLLYRGLRGARSGEERSAFSSKGRPQIYVMLLGLTLLNPVTVTYFTTFILGIGRVIADSSLNSFLFVAGAFLASFSWQTLLAGLSGLAHRRLSQGLQRGTFAAGNLLIITIGIAILLGLI
jgi:arginine exporter protein ArgO